MLEVTDFIVAPREVRQFSRNTIVRASGRAQIDGAVICADGSGAGADGVSLIVETQGQIVVTGSMLAGRGQDGADGDTGGNGGDGGSLTLRSANGDIVLGAPAQGDAAAPANGGGTTLRAGDAGNGGEGHLGGAGGAGGSVMLSCGAGTLTINQAPGLFHVGNGGHGGRGVVGGEDLHGFVLPDQVLSHGGKGGQLLVEAQDVQGLQMEDGGTTDDGTPVRVGVLDSGVADGGTGGDGGDFFYGVDPETGESTWPEQVRVGVRPAGRSSDARGSTQGARGGDGYPRGGRGGSCSCHGEPGATNPDYRNVSAIGGDGGNVTADVATVWQETRVLFGTELRGGHGGDAKAVGGRGAHGDACADGGRGGDAGASGGNGGHVLVQYLVFQYNQAPGRGGDAKAVSGAGGEGGDCCSPTPGQGGNGGDGGWARAWGGAGGTCPGHSRGPGGDGIAIGGDGGVGGNGRLPGGGGSGGTAQGTGGEGNPVGGRGSWPGHPGRAGANCPAAPPAVGITYRNSRASSLNLDLSWLELPRPRTAQAGQVTLGGDNNPLRAFPGQSLTTSANGLDLWVAREGTGIGLYRNFASGGDRPPEFILTINGVVGESFWPTSLWLDTDRDILYCTYKPQQIGAGTNRLLAWHNASALNANVAPHRRITVSNARELSSITGDPTGDRAYVIELGSTGNFEVGVLDNLSLRNGAAAADRVITNVVRGWTGIACDHQRDILYLQRENLTTGDHAVAIVNNASAANGNAPYRTLHGPATGLQAPAGSLSEHVPTCLQVIPEENLLVLATTQGDIMAFANASALDGNVAPVKTAGLVGANPVAMLAWRTD